MIWDFVSWFSAQFGLGIHTFVLSIPWLLGAGIGLFTLLLGWDLIVHQLQHWFFRGTTDGGIDE